MMNTIMDDLRIYMKTDNHEILNKVKKYDRNKIELYKKWGEFQDKYHVKLIGWDQHNGNVIIGGVIGDTSVFPGQWRKPDHNGVSSPFKKNHEAWKLLSNMELEAPDLGDDIPEVTVETYNECGYFINTVFFEYDGFVYVSCSLSAEPDQNVWTKIDRWEFEKAKLGSEFDKAEEEKNKT